MVSGRHPSDPSLRVHAYDRARSHLLQSGAQAVHLAELRLCRSAVSGQQRGWGGGRWGTSHQHVAVPGSTLALRCYMYSSSYLSLPRWHPDSCVSNRTNQPVAWHGLQSDEHDGIPYAQLTLFESATPWGPWGLFYKQGTALSGSISTGLTGLSWICVGIHSRRALPPPVCA